MAEELDTGGKAEEVGKYVPVQSNGNKMTPEQMAMRISGLEMEVQYKNGILQEHVRILEKWKKEAEDLKEELRLNPRLRPKNPFEAVLWEMAELQRSKAQDYAKEGDTLANFRTVVTLMNLPGYTILEDINAMIIRKCARINNLRGRSPANESLWDSYLDRAVYAVLACVALMEPEFDPDDYNYIEDEDGD